jgi:hypothetical protein
LAAAAWERPARRLLITRLHEPCRNMTRVLGDQVSPFPKVSRTSYISRLPPSTSILMALNVPWGRRTSITSRSASNVTRRDPSSSHSAAERADAGTSRAATSAAARDQVREPRMEPPRGDPVECKT